MFSIFIQVHILYFQLFELVFTLMIDIILGTSCVMTIDNLFALMMVENTYALMGMVGMIHLLH